MKQVKWIVLSAVFLSCQTAFSQPCQVNTHLSSPTNIGPGFKAGQDFVPGEVIVYYHSEGATDTPKGALIKTEHDNIAKAVGAKFNLSVKSYRAISDVIVDQMTRGNLSEQELFAKILSDRKAAGKRPRVADPFKKRQLCENASLYI